jgi:diguanylate cyclase (GGDEF)-like protein/PAS domain S-box-containing protein
MREMTINHNLLLRQLKKLSIDTFGTPPNADQWAKFLERVNSAYTDADQERYLLERSHEIASKEMQELYSRIEESQRIAGLGNWTLDRLTGTARCSKECYRIFGIASAADLPTYRKFTRSVHRDDRIDLKDRIEAALHDGKTFELEFRYLLPHGATQWIRAIGQPIKDSDGKVIRLEGTIMDVTRRKLAELRQSMEHTVTRLLADSDAPEEVMPEIIETVCQTLDWVCGAWWKFDRQSETLLRSGSWSLHDPRIEKFFDCFTQEIDAKNSVGLIAASIHLKVPQWHPDISKDSDPLLANQAHASGLHAALALPITVNGELLGIMTFFNTQAQRSDQNVLQSAHFISRHIGQFWQRKQAEDALRVSEAHFRSLVEQATDSFYVHDIEGNIIDANQHGCDYLGYAREELLMLKMADIDIDLSIDELKSLHEQTGLKAPVALESRHKRKDGSIFPVEIRMGPIEINGQRYLLSLVRDIAERKQLQAHIQHLAFHDALTDLPNRAMFNRHLSHAIRQAQRYNRGLAVLFIDLDRFKNINDTLGHNAGDRLLQEMARRLTSCLRSSDVVSRANANEDMVARLGGDEFVVLIENVTDSARISLIARKILTAMDKEFPLDGQIIHVTGSVGISIFPEDGSNEFSLMKHADIAMYRAKEKGKNNFQFYSTQMDQHAAESLALESGLRRALERNELVLFYQAKVELQTGLITGVEALVRWQHPELGLVSPVHFISIAEESGLIVPLSQWVLKQACLQNLAWQKQGLPKLRVAVNLSARQFLDDNLLSDTVATLHEVGMSPEMLEFEVTESMMMQNPEKAVQALTELRQLGIRIAIDDFGIGYSSLSHLKQFPIDIIKIDRSFIKDIPGDKADEAITEAIIAMGKSLKIAIVAEGVETARQLHFLRDRGCDYIQGYFFSRPVHANDFAALIRKNMVDLIA